MKRTLLLLLLALPFNFVFAQQNIPLSKTSSVNVKSVKKVVNKDKSGAYLDATPDASGKIPDSITVAEKSDEKVFGVFGVSSLNKEELEKFNASGKFSCFVRPLINARSNVTVYLSFNKNATNNDSLLASTLIFPEVGNNSFLGTVEYAIQVDHSNNYNKRHFLVPFFEFSNKNIKVSQDTAEGKTVNYHFSTLNYTLGCKYLFRFSKKVEDKTHDVNFGFAPYLSYLNIPNQDTADYRILLKSKTISDNLWSAGVKVSIQYNFFSVFADFRHVLGSSEKIPVRELRGFNSNIGIILHADLFSL